MLAAALMFVIKTALLCLLMLGCYRGLEKHSARLRYQWLTLAVLLIIFFPVIDYLLNSFSIVVALRPSHLLLQEAAQLLSLAWVQYGLLLYSFVTSWLCLYFVIGHIQLMHISRQAGPPNRQLEKLMHELSKKIALAHAPKLCIHHRADISPCTFGVFNTVILLPADAPSWPRAQLELVLLHELAHIKHRDFLKINTVRLLVSVYWFVPPLWYLLRELKKLSEQLADDTVINAGANDADYAQILLEAGRLHKQASAMAVAVNGNGAYYQRVMTVLDRYVDRTAQKNQGPRSMFLFLIFCFVAAASVDLELHDKGYREIPLKFIDITQVRIRQPQAAWQESLKVTALTTGELSPPLMMSGYLAGELQLPDARYFAELGQDVDVQAQFSIDPHGKAFDIELQPKNLSQELRQELAKSIRQSQFAQHRLNGEAITLTGVKQRYQLSKE